jgi:hypothetical protein
VIVYVSVFLSPTAVPGARQSDRRCHVETVSGNFSSRCARPGKNVLHDWAAEHLDCHLSECNDPPAKI